MIESPARAAPRRQGVNESGDHAVTPRSEVSGQTA
jgi:hypothetical protein